MSLQVDARISKPLISLHQIFKSSNNSLFYSKRVLFRISKSTQALTDAAICA
jgi:hypothetical protein